MREIKFRAWDELLQAWVHEPLWFEGSTAFALRDGSFLELNTIRIKVSQYTGLKDKNGKEIYEGDILNNGMYPHVMIFWDKEYAGFRVTTYSCIKKLSQFVNTWEVIGNIYENPNLIENDKS